MDVVEYSGGYAKVTYDVKTCKIIKKQPLYRHKTIDFNTICEAIFSRAVAGKPHLCQVEDIRMDDAKTTLEITMPYYGESLSNWTHVAAIGVRRMHVKDIILGVTRALMELEVMGMQHTDVKPTNILLQFVKGTLQVTLIDLNICAVRSTEDPSKEWSEALGTWTYVAPEIVDAMDPKDTSPCWSIAMLICFILYKHPLTQWVRQYQVDLDSQSDWQDLYKFLKNEHPEKMPICSSMLPFLEYEDDVPWLKIVEDCTDWDPDKRPSLSEVYWLIAKSDYTPCQLFPVWLYPATSDKDLRTACLKQIYHFLKKHDMSFLIIRSMGLLDHFHNHNDHTWIVPICIILSILISGNYVTCYKPIFEELCVEYQIKSTKRFCSTVYDIVGKYRWDIYDEPADVLLHRYVPQMPLVDIYDKLYHTILDLQESYTMQLLAQRVLKDMAM